MIYQLTYELRHPDKDYTDFYSYLEKEIGDGALHVLRDAWWFTINQDDNGEIIDHLCENIKQRLGDNDVFFISSVTPGQINGWLAQSSWNWYQTHKD